MNTIHYHFETLDSTNNWLKENFSKLQLDNLYLVTADCQTAGRGRFDRRWVSPKGKNIYASFFFCVDKKRRDVGNLAQILAISTIDVLKKGGVDCRIKWPNDIFLNGKKLGGILCETISLSDKLGVINGIGINVNATQEELDKIETPATSLLVESGCNWNVDNLIGELTNSFNNNLEIFLKKGFLPFLPIFKSLCFFPLHPIKFIRGIDKLEGICENINADGTLNIRLKNGDIICLSSGELL